MTTEAIHEALALSKGSPIRVVCDNMLIFMSNNTKYKYHNDIEFPDVIWIDDKELMISIRPSTQYEQSQFPIEISIVPYEMIQYIQVYATINDTTAIADLLKTYISEPQQKIIKNMLDKRRPKYILQPEPVAKTEEGKK